MVYGALFNVLCPLLSGARWHGDRDEVAQLHLYVENLFVFPKFPV